MFDPVSAHCCVFVCRDHQNIERVEEALSVLASLGATVVDPGPESDGLFTPCLRELWPVLVNTTACKRPFSPGSVFTPIARWFR